MNIQANTAPRVPAHEQVYRQIRAMVMFGELAPGQAVTIQGLVDQTGAGMTPVREALRRLTTEGALAFMGNRRIMVPELDPDTIAELTEARLALEPRLAARAAVNFRASDIKALRAIDDRLDHAIARGDVRRYLEENHAFHAAVNAQAKAPILTTMVEGLWLRFGPSLRVVCGQFGTRTLPDRHKDMLDAFAAGDAPAAQRAMQEDIEQGMDMMTRCLPDRGPIRS